MEEISISANKLVLSEALEGIVTSIFKGAGVLTCSKSENLGIIPFKFPLHSHHRKSPISETQSSPTEIQSSSTPQNP